MQLPQLARQIDAFYLEMGETFSQAQARANLNCLPNCGRCCTTPEIEASLWEMLPMAYAIDQQGRSEEILNELLATQDPTCWAYQAKGEEKGSGQCRQYADRPTVCREFGVAGLRDKNGGIRLSVCKYIREENPQQTVLAENTIAQWAPPIMNEWVMRLMQLHPSILHERRPINLALAEALNKVLLYKGLNYS